MHAAASRRTPSASPAIRGTLISLMKLVTSTQTLKRGKSNRRRQQSSPVAHWLIAATYFEKETRQGVSCTISASIHAGGRPPYFNSTSAVAGPEAQRMGIDCQADA